MPKWLKSLQESSWEIEILISGGAIFSLFQFSEFYIDWVQNLRMVGHFPGGGILLMVGMIGIKVLTVGFVLHLLFRAFWLALVCINYVYPQGIKEKKINARKPFRTQQTNDSSLKEQIIQVDKYCGTVMYLSIVSALSIFGFTVCFFALFSLPLLFDDIPGFNGFFTVFGNAYLLLMLVYFIDLILFGLLRKIPVLSYLLVVPFRLFDLLSFRKWYQKSLQLHSSNVNRFSMFFVGLLFFSVSVFLAYLSILHVMHWPNLTDSREYRWQMTDNNSYLSDMHYMDQWGTTARGPVAALESKRITGNYAELFIRYDKIADFYIDELDLPDSSKNTAAIIELIVDDKVLENISWLKTKKKNGRIGISSFLDLNAFKNGRHDLQINIKDELLVKDNTEHLGVEKTILSIPFWIDRPSFPVPIYKDSL